MSRPFWKEPFRQSLKNLPKPKAEQPSGVVILGIGNELRGDDAAGITVARALLPALAAQEHVHVIEAGAAPENQTGAIRRYAPALVILVDAAQMDEPPGTVRWLSWEETDGLSASTHTLPPYVLAKFLVADIGCTVALLGIQPVGTALDTPLSPVVQAAVDDVVATLLAELV